MTTMHGRWDGTGRNGDGPRQLMIVAKIMVWRGPSSISGDHKTLVRSTSYLQSSKKVFGHGWENAAGKLRQKREATAGTKLTKPRTKTSFGLYTPVEQERKGLVGRKTSLTPCFSLPQKEPYSFSFKQTRNEEGRKRKSAALALQFWARKGRERERDAHDSGFRMGVW